MADAAASIADGSWEALLRMMEASDPELPKFRQLESAILEAVRKGLLEPGKRLPTERALAERFGVSLGTAQKAMTCLAQDGIVTRARRRGTFIAGRTVAQEDIYVFRFKDPRTGKFVEPLIRMLSVTVAALRGPWNAFLGSDRLVRFERLMRVGLEPPVYSEFFVAHDHGAHLLGRPLDEIHSTSLHRLLGERFDRPTVRVEHKLTCAVFADEVCGHLMAPPGSPGLVWDIGGYSHADVPTTFQRIHVPIGHRAVEIDSRF